MKMMSSLSFHKIRLCFKMTKMFRGSMDKKGNVNEACLSDEIREEYAGCTRERQKKTIYSDVVGGGGEEKIENAE